MTLTKLGCWLRNRCQSPWTWVGAAALATVQAFTGAVGGVAMWALSHASGLFTLTAVTGTAVGPRVGLPTWWVGPAIVATGTLLVGSIVGRWVAGWSA